MLHTVQFNSYNIASVMKRTLPIMARPWTWQRALPYIFIIASCIGLLASFVLSYDKMRVLADPSFKPPCNINPILSCGSVMGASQSEVGGIPNTFFGIAAFTALGVVGVLLLTGVKLVPWIWRTMHGVAAAGLGAMLYLYFQSVFRIHAICPWCFFVWLTVFPIFLGISVYTIREHIYKVPRSKVLALICYVVQKYPSELLVLWYALLIGLLLVKFWYYWGTLL